MLKASREVTITVTMDEEYAGKLERSLLRVLTAVEKNNSEVYDPLVNTGTVDDLISLRQVINEQLPEGGCGNVQVQDRSRPGTVR